MPNALSSSQPDTSHPIPSHDLLIIGGGPAGISAGVYAARKLLKTAIISQEIGGQSTVSEGIENWIGTVKISGNDLAKSLKAHLNAYKGDLVSVHEGETVEKLTRTQGGFTATTKSGKSMSARAVLIASGASRRKLTIPGADTFEHKGLTYCASCDGPLFAGQDVAVVGAGNAGFETALQLLAYAKSVTLISRGATFRADPVTVQKASEHSNMRILTQTDPVEVIGEKFVTGLIVRNSVSNEATTLPVTGIFVEIGVVPNTDFVEGLVELDTIKRVVTDPRNQRARLVSEIQTPEKDSDARHGNDVEGAVHPSTVTETSGTRNNADESFSGVWAAGDCTDELYHQNNIAAGDAVKALEDIYIWLKKQ
jgi:alkyl hydroperoxide reductase subunit F